MKRILAVIKSIFRTYWKICYYLGGALVVLVWLLPLWIIVGSYRGKDTSMPSSYHNFCEKYGAYNNSSGRCYFYDIETNDVVLEDAVLEFGGFYKDSLALYRVCNKKTRKRQEEGLCGYFNTNTGEVQIEPQYQRAWDFNDGIAPVCQNDSIFFIDTQGKPINDKKFPYENNYFYVYDGEYCHVKIDDKYGVIDRQGEWVLDPIWDNITIRNSYFYVNADGVSDAYRFPSCPKNTPNVMWFWSQGDTLFTMDKNVIYVRQDLKN